MKQPPPLPSETLRRVLRVARIDGYSVLGFAGACALVAAAMGDPTGAVIGLLIAGTGAIEIHGVALLRRGSFNGMRWLVSSQVYLMSTVMAYCALKLQHPDLSVMRRGMAFMNSVLGPDFNDQVNAALAEKGETMDHLLLGGVVFLYLALAVLTVLYQGGMIMYYLRRRNAVAAALEEDESL